MTAEGQKQPECPPTDGWTQRTWHMRAMKSCAAVNRKEILVDAATGVDLENVSEISQAWLRVV